MKKVLICVAAAVFFALGVGSAWCQEAPIATGKVVFQDENQDGVVLIDKPDSKWVNTTAASHGVSLATLYAIPNMNVSLHSMKIEKGGFIIPHKGDVYLVTYVASGKGILEMKNGAKMDLKPGITIVQWNNTIHGYTNTGDETLELVYMRVAPIAK